MSENDRSDDGKKARAGGGITRRELFHGLGSGALAAGLFAGGGGLVDRVAEAASPEEKAPESPPSKILGPGPVAITLTVNGKSRALSVEPRTTLLEVLRDRLALTGAKPSCERGACGACTVIMDGLAVDACMTLAIDAWGRSVTTVEGLAKGAELSPLQRSFIEHDALQCGFCTPGMLMSCTALLEHSPKPSLDEAKRAVAGNLCRCGTYPKVFEATMAVGAVGPAGKKA